MMPTKQLSTQVCFQLRARKRAHATGTVIIELTISAPTVRAAMETLRAQMKMKLKLMSCMRTPAMRAAVSSRDTQNSSRENTRQ